MVIKNVGLELRRWKSSRSYSQGSLSQLEENEEPHNNHLLIPEASQGDVDGGDDDEDCYYTEELSTEWK